MKLAEALILRKDLQTRMEQLRDRLVMNARVQEGEQPAEDPNSLLSELEQTAVQLEELICRINLTNASVVIHDELTITELLAHRECLSQKVSILRSFLDSASNTVMRGSRTEVKILSTVPVAQLRKQADDLSRQLRTCDTEIQAANWTTELQ